MFRVDSSYMAYLAHVDKTFTVGFANKQYDETDYAAEFSKFMGVKNYAYRIEPEEYWAELRIQYHMDEPLADAASVALYFVNWVGRAGEGLPVRRGRGRVLWRLQHLQGALHRLLVRPYPPAHPAGHRRGGGTAAPGARRKLSVRRSRPLEERYIGNTNLMGERRKKQLLKHDIGGKNDRSFRLYLKKTAGRIR